MEFLGFSLIGIGVAMDAFAVSVCKGLSMKKMSWKKAIIISIYFGTFQALMPAIRIFIRHRISTQCRTNRSLACILPSWSYWN